MANFKNKKPKVSRAGCLCGGKWHKKVTGCEKRKFASELDEPRKPRPKKNRRKWCKGREGIEHKPEWIPHRDRNLDFKTGREKENPEMIYQIQVCTVCSRHLDWRSIHAACGKSHPGWGYGWYHKDRETGEYVRKPYPCEEEGTGKTQAA